MSTAHAGRWVLALGFAASAAAGPAYEPAGDGTRVIEIGAGVSIRMLVEAANLGGGEVEVGRLHIPAGYESSGHAHGSIEIFYVLAGTLEHVVNGEAHVLAPGMVGIVRAGDEVIHRVPGTTACEALVIWVPGGEAERLARRYTVRPLP